ncbi:MAG TPA: very short patch repair endonuclease [Solirubrobacterales bacterium]
MARSSAAARPAPSSAAKSAEMSKLGRRDTLPERAIRSELHRRGLRFRVDRAPLAGLRSRADIVFGPARVAVYVDGCFWHSCPQHGTKPKANAEWWEQKLRRNQERDLETDRVLREHGWEVVRIWEHEDPVEAADQVWKLVQGRRNG